MSKELEIYIDGASQGNPGPSGAGVVIAQEGQTVKNISIYLGDQTNNFAEYAALIFGLQEALILRASIARVYTDSQLLFRQINNDYKIKSYNLIGLYQRARHLLSAFERVEVKYIPREENRGADKLARKAIKDKSKAQVEVAALQLMRREESPNSGGQRSG